MTVLPYLLLFVTPATVAIAIAFGGPLSLLTPMVLFGVVPLADLATGWNRENRTASGGEAAFRAVPIGFVLLQLLLLAVGLAHVVGTGPLAERLGLLISLGFSSGISIAVAHELMHRPGRFERFLADVVMTSVLYPHFSIEHVQGHHRNVATPADPATSRRGESLYRFMPRTLVGGLRSAWNIETTRLSNTGRQMWSIENRMLRYALGTLATLALVPMVLGPVGLLAFVAQAAIAVFLLETINYIEHYGLVRHATEGRFERVRPEHSWNASHRVTNWMIVNLARHSDHHAFPSRAYPELRHYEDVPQMPAGYPAMLILALVPPLWFSVMDPRVDALQAFPPARA